MPELYDPNPAFAGYADPRRLVSTEWLSANIGNPKVKVVESNEDPALYDIGHVPGAIKLDWAGELYSDTVRDLVDGAEFAELMQAKGIDRDSTVVLYGDHFNHWAGFTAWVLSLFGHADVRLLDGGREAWHNEGRETTLDLPWPSRVPAHYPEVERNDKALRVFKDSVTDSGHVLLDVRCEADHLGGTDRTARHGGGLRRGHIPGAVNIPDARALIADGRFRPAPQLREVYAELPTDAEIVVYGATGEQAARTWFALTHLLGYPAVRVYDGSWAEWGNAVGTPIARRTSGHRDDA